MTGRVVYIIFEGELLLSIIDGETGLGIVRIDDGFCGAQKRLAQDNGCPCNTLGVRLVFCTCIE
jgi:hypothetical protein